MLEVGDDDNEDHNLIYPRSIEINDKNARPLISVSIRNSSDKVI